MANEPQPQEPTEPPDTTTNPDLNPNEPATSPRDPERQEVQEPLSPAAQPNGTNVLVILAIAAAVGLATILFGLSFRSCGGEKESVQITPSPSASPASACPEAPCLDPDYDPSMTPQQFYMVRQKKQDYGWNDEHKFLRGQNDKLATHIMNSDNDHRDLIRELSESIADMAQNSNNSLTAVAQPRIETTARTSGNDSCGRYTGTRYHQSCLAYR